MIEVVWDDSVPVERRAEYDEAVRRCIRAEAARDGPPAVRARVFARADGLHWELEAVK